MAEQASLPLDTAPCEEPGLRAAWEACPELHKLYTFQQAMSLPDIGGALRNTAHAMRRARREATLNLITQLGAHAR